MLCQQPDSEAELAWHGSWPGSRGVCLLLCRASQYYTSGDYCQMVSAGRKAHVSLVCDPSATVPVVVSESEMPTCNYNFMVLSASVWCAWPPV